MKRIGSWAAVPADIQIKLSKISDKQKSKSWDGKSKAVKEFKRLIMDHGLAVQQERCAWCTLLVGDSGRRTAHRDHIAPKGSYGKWTFLAQNLLIACEFCNGFAVKGTLDTIAVDDVDYNAATFWLVHPYMDDPEDHLEFTVDDDGARLLVTGRTPKGKWTIDRLSLSSAGLAKERYKDHLFAVTKARVSPELLDLYMKATGRSS